MQREDVEREASRLRSIAAGSDACLDFKASDEFAGLADMLTALLDRAEKAEAEVAALIHDIERAKEQHMHLLAERDEALIKAASWKIAARRMEAERDKARALLRDMSAEAEKLIQHAENEARIGDEYRKERDAALAAGQEDMRERAAKACDRLAGDPRMYNEDRRRSAGQCGAAIRALPIRDKP